MVVSEPPPGYEDYWRMWWRAARKELGRAAAMLALAVPGLAAGLRITDGWTSEWAATQVAVLCAIATVAIGYLGWRLVNRVVRGPRPRAAPLQLCRAVLRGEGGLVTPPAGAGAWVTGLVGVVAWAALATIACGAPAAVVRDAIERYRDDPATLSRLGPEPEPTVRI